MLYYTIIHKLEKQIGLIGCDEIGRIQYVGQKGIIKSLETFFRDHKAFKVNYRDGDQLLTKMIETKNQIEWIKELRRQLPAPYYGKSIIEMVGILDSLSSVWEALNGDKKYDISRFS